MEFVEINIFSDGECRFWDETFTNCAGGFPSWSYCSSVLRYYAKSGEISLRLWLAKENGLFVGACIFPTPEKFSGVYWISPTMGAPYPWVFVNEPTKKRKVRKILFEFLLSLCGDDKVIYLTDYGQNNIGYDDSRWCVLDYTSLYLVNRVIGINLNNPLNILEQNLHKYHRRNIRKALRNEDIETVFLDHKANEEELYQSVETAKELHYVAAGKRTRPRDSWLHMVDMVKNGFAIMALLRHKGASISYIIAFLDGSESAVGASQANLSEYNYLNPRHRLEWEMILYLKSAGYQTYEVGQRYTVSHPLRQFSPKEVAMTEFKERFGGDIAPRVHAWIAKDPTVSRYLWRDSIEKYLSAVD